MCVWGGKRWAWERVVSTAKSIMQDADAPIAADEEGCSLEACCDGDWQWLQGGAGCRAGRRWKVSYVCV